MKSHCPRFQIQLDPSSNKFFGKKEKAFLNLSVSLLLLSAGNTQCKQQSWQIIGCLYRCFATFLSWTKKALNKFSSSFLKDYAFVGSYIIASFPFLPTTPKGQGGSKQLKRWHVKIPSFSSPQLGKTIGLHPAPTCNLLGTSQHSETSGALYFSSHLLGRADSSWFVSIPKPKVTLSIF